MEGTSMLTLTAEAGPYWAGDSPAAPYVAGIDDDGEAVEFTDEDIVEAGLRSPDGVTYAIPRAPRPVDTTTDTFTMEWGDDSPFTTAGVYWLDAWYGTERVNPKAIVVEGLDGWATLDLAREQWRDLPSNARVAYNLLQIAKADILPYAPALPEGGRPPVNYVQAQIMHARDIWNAGAVDPSTGDLGSDQFALTPFPLDWMIRQILRPKRAVPKVPRYREDGA